MVLQAWASFVATQGSSASKGSTRHSQPWIMSGGTTQRRWSSSDCGMRKFLTARDERTGYGSLEPELLWSGEKTAALGAMRV